MLSLKASAWSNHEETAGVFRAGAGMVALVKHKQFACVIAMVATMQEPVLRQNPPIIPIAGCSA